MAYIHEFGIMPSIEKGKDSVQYEAEKSLKKVAKLWREYYAKS